MSKGFQRPPGLTFSYQQVSNFGWEKMSHCGEKICRLQHYSASHPHKYRIRIWLTDSLALDPGNACGFLSWCPSPHLHFQWGNCRKFYTWRMPRWQVWLTKGGSKLPPLTERFHSYGWAKCHGSWWRRSSCVQLTTCMTKQVPTGYNKGFHIKTLDDAPFLCLLGAFYWPWY